jgi:invasion protein IalB
MQRFRWIAPISILLIVTGVSIADAQTTIKPQDSAWVKLCEKATAINRENKEEKKEVNICLTHHDRLDDSTGMVLMSAAVLQFDGQDKHSFIVMVPLGMMLQPGMRATIYPKDAWEKVQKNDKIDETKLKGIRQIELVYTMCHGAGCTAEVEATGELLNDLRTSGGVVVSATNSLGAPVNFVVPLAGFAEALAGPPAGLLNDLRTSGGFVVSTTNSSGAPVNFVIPLVGLVKTLAGTLVVPPPKPAGRRIICAAAEYNWGKAEWRGCSMKPIQEWGR